MTLKSGLAAMRSSRSEEKEAVAPSPLSEVSSPKKTVEKREPFATRLRPSLKYALKQRVLELNGQGERVTVETVIEALLLRYTEDKEFQREVEEGLS
jgi:hypothetical protein